MTSTHNRNVKFQHSQALYDPNEVYALYVRDDDHKSYRPLTAEHHARVLAGAARL